MTTAISTISAEPTVRSLVQQTVSSLPASYRIAGDEPADITVIDGTKDWAVRASVAVLAGAEEILVVDPRPTKTTSVGDLITMAASEGTRLDVIESFAGNPAITAARADTHLPLARSRVVFERAVDSESSIDAIIFDQLRVLRALPVECLEVIDAEVTSDAATVAIRARSGGAASLVRLLAIRSTAQPRSHRIRAHGPDEIVKWYLPGPENARPAHVSIVTPSGERVLPTIHQTALRDTLLRRRDRVPTTPRLDGVLDDIELLTSMMQDVTI